MNSGEIYLARFPFTDGTAAKLRPVLVISNRRYNNADVVVLPISSRPDPNDEFAVFIGNPHFSQAGLRQESSIKWTKPMTIASSVFQRRLGTLPKTLFDETVEKVKHDLFP